jgi:parallel beta-helix repeat protein
MNVSVLGPGLITNGGVNTFSEGIRLTMRSNGGVSGITVVGSGVGIICFQCNFVTITASTLGRNGVGITINDSISNTISDNDISGTGRGIYLTAAEETFISAATVSHNVLNGNTVGLLIDSGAGARVLNNVINGNDQYGIFVAEPLQNYIEVTNNTSLANGRFDLFD